MNELYKLMNWFFAAYHRKLSADFNTALFEHLKSKKYREIKC